MDIQKGKLTSDDVKAVEDEAQGDLKGFPYVLETIKEIVIAHRRKGTTEPSSLCWGGGIGGCDESCLPESAIALFLELQ